MSLHHALLCAVLLSALAMPASAQEQEPASADTFEREVLNALRASVVAKRSVTVHVGGTAHAGLVQAIGPDVVVLANRERSRIMIRRERIDVVEAE